jgi:SAM-dependent methyltransferase
VIQRLDRDRLVALLRECRRVLRPGGMLVLTTPAARAEKVLRWMAKLNLVSADAREEHGYAHSLAQIERWLVKAGFELEKVRFGEFEWGFNGWVTAVG